MILRAEFVNGGYILFDDISVTGTKVNLSGQEELKLNDDLKISPNPFHGENVSVQGKNILRVNVFDRLVRLKF